MGYFLWTHGIGRSQAVTAAAPATTLKLASEVPAAGPAALRAGVAGTSNAMVAGDEAVAPELLAHVQRCVSVGPFNDASEAEHAASTLRGGGYEPRERVFEDDVRAGITDPKRRGIAYWIDIDLKPSDAVPKPAELHGEAGHISRLEIRACPALAGQP